MVFKLIPTVIKNPTFSAILTSACSTPYTFQAGTTVQRSDQDKQQGVSYARRTLASATPITHARRS